MTVTSPAGEVLLTPGNREVRLSLLTQHGNEGTLRPPFAERLGAHLELATGFDTDNLGTFTRGIRGSGS